MATLMIKFSAGRLRAAALLVAMCALAVSMSASATASAGVPLPRALDTDSHTLAERHFPVIWAVAQTW